MTKTDWPALLPEADWTELRPVVSSDAGESASEEALPRRAVETAGIRALLEDAAAVPAERPERLPLLVVNDPHRATNTRRMLEALFRFEERLGLAVRWRLLVAAGSHPAPEEEEERRRYVEAAAGPYFPRLQDWAWHDADGATAPVTTAAGETFRVHPWAAAARTLLGIGSVEPHYFAGATGAHKTLSVGLLSRADIEANHAAACAPTAAGLCLEGNPVHEGFLRVLRALRNSGCRLAALNEVRAGGRLFGCWSGEPEKALAAALPTVRRLFAHRVATPADLVVAEVEPPLDRDFYQADKGVKNVEVAVRDGGVLLLCAECRLGVGLDRFVQLLTRAPSLATAEELLHREGYRLGDHKALRLRALTDERLGRGVRLGLFAPGLPEKITRLTGFPLFRRAREAVAWVRRSLPSGVSSGNGEQGWKTKPRRALLVRDAGNITLRR